MTIQDQIFAATAKFVPRTEPVNVPDWPGLDGQIFVRELSALEDEQFGDICRRSNADPTISVTSEAVVLSLVDASGARVFTAKDAAAKLAAGPVAPIDIVWNKFLAMRPKKGEAEKKPETPSSAESSPLPTSSDTPTPII